MNTSAIFIFEYDHSQMFIAFINHFFEFDYISSFHDRLLYAVA